MTSKARYFQKKYDEAPMIECACGCGTLMKSVDKYARPKTFVSGHNGRKYEVVEDTATAAKKRWRKANPDWVKEDKKKRHRERKVKAILHMGGKCVHCDVSYSGKNAPIFEFHHENPEMKEYNIGNKITNYSWEKTLTELAKCVLLCASCHRQHHGGEW